MWDLCSYKQFFKFGSCQSPWTAFFPMRSLWIYRLILSFLTHLLNHFFFQPVFSFLLYPYRCLLGTYLHIRYEIYMYKLQQIISQNQYRYNTEEKCFTIGSWILVFQGSVICNLLLCAWDGIVKCDNVIFIHFKDWNEAYFEYCFPLLVTMSPTL